MVALRALTAGAASIGAMGLMAVGMSRLCPTCGGTGEIPDVEPHEMEEMILAGIRTIEQDTGLPAFFDRTVDTIGEAFGMGRFEVIRIMKGMIDRGVIDVGGSTELIIR